MKLSVQHWVIYNITDTFCFSIHDTYRNTYRIVTKYRDTYRIANKWYHYTPTYDLNLCINKHSNIYA